MCGVIGIWANDSVIRDLYQGLLAMQHPATFWVKTNTCVADFLLRLLLSRERMELAARPVLHVRSSI